MVQPSVNHKSKLKNSHTLTRSFETLIQLTTHKLRFSLLRTLQLVTNKVYLNVSSFKPNLIIMKSLTSAHILIYFAGALNATILQPLHKLKFSFSVITI